MRLEQARVTVVGLGLIGGSLAGALRGRYAAVVGVDMDAETIDLAAQRGLVDRAVQDLRSGLTDCDLVILAVPVRSILTILAQLGKDLPLPRFIMDVGSTKVEIVRAMQDLPAAADPCGGHPLCGKETSGVTAAERDLFRGQTFVLTPLPRTSSEILQIADELVSTLGARPKIMQAEEHDRLLASTSHLPYMLASALVACADEVSAADPGVWELASSGFRDTTRLAASGTQMMMDILATNRSEISATIRRARRVLSSMELALEVGDLGGLEEQLARARSQRIRLDYGQSTRSEGVS